jgi:hypothetical protein
MRAMHFKPSQYESSGRLQPVAMLLSGASEK